MTRVHVVVEGQTEQSFVNEVLAPALWTRQIFLRPILLGVHGHKGGRVTYARVRRDILVQLKQDSAVYISTMLDFYGLGEGFPGTPLPTNLSNIEKVTHIEQEVKKNLNPPIRASGLRRAQLCVSADRRAALCAIRTLHPLGALRWGDQRMAVRSYDFHPPLSADWGKTSLRWCPNCRPTFDSSLTYNCTNLKDCSSAIHRRLRAASTKRILPVSLSIREGFPTPEDVNDSPTAAPSKRVLRLCGPYRKVPNGTQAAMTVGVETMRRECPRFREWLERLEQLGA